MKKTPKLKVSPILRIIVATPFLLFFVAAYLAYGWIGVFWTFPLYLITITIGILTTAIKLTIKLKK